MLSLSMGEIISVIIVGLVIIGLVNIFGDEKN